MKKSCLLSAVRTAMLALVLISTFYTTYASAAASTISRGALLIDTDSNVLLSSTATADICVTATAGGNVGGVADYVGAGVAAACTNKFTKPSGALININGAGVAGANKFPGGVPSNATGSFGIEAAPGQTHTNSDARWIATQTTTFGVTFRQADLTCASRVTLIGGPTGLSSCKVSDPWIFSPTLETTFNLGLTLDDLEITNSGFLSVEYNFGIGNTSGVITNSLFSDQILLTASDLIGGITEWSIPDFSTTLAANTTYVLHADLATFAQAPVPAAFWLFGSGLLGLIGISRRKKPA